MTIDISSGNMNVHSNSSEPWKITLLDTGLNTMTGSRIKKAKEHIGDETFLVTYGDGVADIDIDKTIDFHSQHGKLVTMTAAQPDGRFGALEINSKNQVFAFNESLKVMVHGSMQVTLYVNPKF